MVRLGLTILLFFLGCASTSKITNNGTDFQILTIVKEETDAVRRFYRSARIYDVDVKVLDAEGGHCDPVKLHGEDSVCGHVRPSRGGGSGYQLLRKELQKYKNNKNKIIMFTSSEDTIINARPERIVGVFQSCQARILYSAGEFGLSDESLTSKYPKVDNGRMYLNSGAFMGYASDIYDVLTTPSLQDVQDPELFSTRVYLDNKLRNKHNIKIDHTSKIFQNLQGAENEVEIRYYGDETYLQNTVYNTAPAVVRGDGSSKLLLNILGDYLGGAYSGNEGCLACKENTIDLTGVQDKNLPIVVIGIFVEQVTPFFEEFLTFLYDLDYPKNRIHLYVHRSNEYNKKRLDEYLEKHGNEYSSVTYEYEDEDMEEEEARANALNLCVEKNCGYYFNVDATAHLRDPSALKVLIQQNRPVVAPYLAKFENEDNPNFRRYSTPEESTEQNSFDYTDIKKGNVRGLWNFAYISSSYLINGDLLRSDETRPSFADENNPEKVFCDSLRKKGIFMYVSNMIDFGHVLSTKNFKTQEHLHDELYEYFNNRIAWERRYIVSNFSNNLDQNYPVHEPCPDVYWFPVVTPRFCREMIEITEDHGLWSPGTNEDERIPGGYEAVPTRDIHMNQIDMEEIWQTILKDYVLPLQRRVFPGHYSEEPNSYPNFVARYRIDEQPALQPHNDASTFSINMALNRPGIDYQGGGTRFVRYNCSVTDSRVGWLLMHPGKLTHHHEGLATTGGTRYILVSFVEHF